MLFGNLAPSGMKRTSLGTRRSVVAPAASSTSAIRLRDECDQVPHQVGRNTAYAFIVCSVTLSGCQVLEKPVQSAVRVYLDLEVPGPRVPIELNGAVRSRLSHREAKARTYLIADLLPYL